MRLRFGEFELDEEAHELRRGGRRVEIRPKVLALLEALVHARPRAMARAELSDRLWPATAVAYTSLPGVAAELRQALADNPAKPRFVRTVRGFGYCFIADAVEVPRKAPRAMIFRCALIWSGRDIGLTDGETLIGRAEECTIRIDSKRISRQHARIVVDASGSAMIEDLGSKNGTFLRGVAVTAPTPLADGDEIAVGPALLVFRADFGPGTTAT
jgi:DNA-binding winged helix-turn-helix (wHTH) protein